MSRLPFELLLALRYLRPKRTFVSIITLISVLGVTLGVAVLIIVISVMDGFDAELREKILGFTGHMRVFQVNTNTGSPVLMQNSAEAMRKINANPAVTGVSPFAVERVLLQTEPPPPAPYQIDSPYLRAIDLQTDAKVSNFARKITSGTADLSGRGLLIGRDIANRFGIQPGDRVALASPNQIKDMINSARTNHQEVRLPDDFEVRGIFDCGYYDFNSTMIIGSMESFQDLFSISNSVEGLALMVKDPDNTASVRKELEKALGPNYSITIWQQEKTPTMEAVMVEKNMMLYILFFIVIVAAFGITCTLITFVVLKTREIGILKALGASSRQVAWVFLSQSLAVSIMGISGGMGLGILGVVYRNPFLRSMRRLTGQNLFDQSVYQFYELPALLVPGDLAIICGGSLVICLLAAAFPVWNASRLKPVEALRHE